MSLETGWPLPCMQRIRASKGLDLWPWERGLSVPMSLQRTNWDEWTSRLPLMPIPAGFAINTSLYGTLSWCGLTALAWLIRKNRRRRQLCIACAYPIAGLATCPECGLHVSPTPNGSPAPAATIPA